MQLSLVAFLLLLFSCYSSSVSAQVSTTPSQSTPDLLDPSAQNWSGTYNTGWWGGVTGGPDPNRLPSDTGFIWSYGNNIISSTIAINQALSQAGIQVNGYSYQWKVKNGNANIFGNQPGIDDFVITVDVYDAQGNVYATYQYDYSYSHNWTIHSGSETFNNPFLPPSYFSNIIVSAQGEDVGYWAGHWGPEFNVADSSLTLTFAADPCYNNPLYDPQCPGYANALFLQQCTANPLYDPACPGYATAYFNQQCTANPLYDPACPGYQTAHYNQQCTNDPLSDPGCPDYYIAQCEKNPLYDMGCVGYDTAYYNYQCSLDAQYDQGCTGYVDMTNDQDFVEIFEPVIEEILENEYTDNVYSSELNVPNFVVDVFEEALDVDITFVDNEEFEQALEDDIEEEIRQLEQDEEPEIDETFEDESETQPEIDEDTQTDSEDSANVGGQQDVDDDIEKEIEELEKDSSEGNDKSLEKEEVQESGKDVRSDPVERAKPDSRREKIRLLIAAKALAATKELEDAITLEQQMEIQRRVLALISFVPDFKEEYTNKELTQVNFYPPKPVVDHQFARWFLNDPNFSTMEDLQYPSLRRK